MTDLDRGKSGTGHSVALVTGITGQDGYYLARWLLLKGYVVHGIVRRSSTVTRGRLDLLRQQLPVETRRLLLHYGDITDAAGMIQRALEIEPDEIYNLAGQSHVRVSFEEPHHTEQVNAGGALNILEAARLLQRRKNVRVYQASTSEMFGGMPEAVPQNEMTPFHPRSPYACAKTAAHYHTVNYRESYGLFACNGILFNHESPLRGESFLTRKVTLAAARISQGLQSEVVLGNLEALRDWGFAGDYVEAMWLMLQQDVPDDYVIATGRSTSVEQFVSMAFSEVGLDWREFVKTDPRFLRPSEVRTVCGDASKAKARLGWTPKMPLEDLVKLMVESDVQLARQERKT